MGCQASSCLIKVCKTSLGLTGELAEEWEDPWRSVYKRAQQFEIIALKSKLNSLKNVEWVQIKREG